MKKRVKILQSIAGAGDPPQAELERKYARIRGEQLARSKAAQAANKVGLTEQQIESPVNEEKRRDAAIPRVSGFIGPFSFKPGDEVSIDAELAEKWEAAGICSILPGDSKKAA